MLSRSVKPRAMYKSHLIISCCFDSNIDPSLHLNSILFKTCPQLIRESIGEYHLNSCGIEW